MVDIIQKRDEDFYRDESINDGDIHERVQKRNKDLKLQFSFQDLLKFLKLFGWIKIDFEVGVSL